MSSAIHKYPLGSTNPDDCYLGNSLVKRDGVTMQMTQDMLEEYIKCSNDPSYFANEYCHVIHPDRGLVPFKLYPYQEKMFNHFAENRFSIVLACRQSGKSISSVCYLLWYACFHPDKLIAVLANKGATSREMLARVTLMLENLPFFLQPGCKALNKGSIEFGNRSRIMAAATSGSSIRGQSVNLLYLDEFAFVENATEFYTSTYPVITAGKTTKVIVTSTANGIGNQFEKIWSKALQGTNEYKAFRVDWWDVPGRDEEWKENTISNTSQLQFDQEFGNTFFGTGDTLITADCLMNLHTKAYKEITKDGVTIYDHPVRDHEYVMCVDVAQGRGQDYSTFNVIDITSSPWKQTAVYRNNMISPLLFPNILMKYGTIFNEALIVIESNDQGMVVCNGLYHDLEYENMYVESAVKANALGIRMDRKVKRLGCSSFKDILEEGKLELCDEETINECNTFEARGQSYEAADGNHDDLVMNFVLFGYFASTLYFSEHTDIDLRKHLYEQNMAAIEADVLPFGIVDDGREHALALENQENIRDHYEPWALMNE